MKEEAVNSAFRRILDAHYVVKAMPQKVEHFAHHLDDTEKNQKLLDFLASKKYETICTLDRGELRLYDTAFVFLDGDKEYPVAFMYLFHETRLDNRNAVQEDDIVSLKRVQDIRIEGLPLGAYCLWGVLLPRYKTVISATQHTDEGERWFKRQIKAAIENGIHVYQRNENGLMADIKTHEETHIRHLWGEDPIYEKRQIIISLDSLI